jgi:hypothetical protein
VNVTTICMAKENFFLPELLKWSRPLLVAIRETTKPTTAKYVEKRTDSKQSDNPMAIQIQTPTVDF